MVKISKHQKIQKKDILLFISIFIYFTIVYGLYLTPHYVHDTYRIYNFGFLQNANGLLSQGRVFAYLFSILFAALDFNVKYVQIFSVLFTIVFLTLSSIILKNLVISRIKEVNKYTEIVLTIVISAIFLNVYITEWMMFMESMIMALGTLFAVISVYSIFNLNSNSKFKYIFCCIFMIISVFCYQSSVMVAGILILLFTVFDSKDKKIATIIIELLKNIIVFVIALVANYIFVKTIGASISNDTRLSGQLDLISNLWFVIRQVKWYALNMFNFMPIYFTLILYIITFSYIVYRIIVKKESIKNMAILFICICSYIIFSVVPVFVMPTGTQYFMARNVPYIAGFIPYILLLFFMLIDNKIIDNKYVRVVVGIYIIVTSICVINITAECLKNNKIDITNGEVIVSLINNYETVTNNKIDSIVLCKENNIQITNTGIKEYGDNTVKAFLHDYSVKEIMAFVTNGRVFNVTYADEQKRDELYGETDYTNFNTDQIKFENNTMYMLVY